tara:strand:- start:51 stop:770 length:720 start_codon:yes stop_codon:yes gene_type:complete
VISIVQNFICSHKERINVIDRNTPKLGDVFRDYEFFVNFNDERNFEKVNEIYKANIPKLSFYNNLEKDWAAVTLALVNQVKTPFVMYICEDIEVTCSKKEMDEFISEFLEEEGEYVFLNKIAKYTQQEFIDGFTPYNNIKSPGYKELNHSYFYLGKHAPHKRLSVDAIYKTDFLKERLEEFLIYGESCTHDIPFRKKHLPNFWEGYYDFDNGMRRFGDMKCYIPKQVIFKEFNDVKDKD